MVPHLHPLDAPELLSGHVCPFCGAVGERAEAACFRCGMTDTTETRQATQARLGPWFVLQKRNPAAPGMNFATLTTLVQRGQVTTASIVRGPTTNQLWCYAGRVRGLSRLMGMCYACGARVAASSDACASCNKSQEPPRNPDALLETRPAQIQPIFKEITSPPEPESPPATEPEAIPQPSTMLLSVAELARAFQAAPPPRPKSRKGGWRRFLIL